MVRDHATLVAGPLDPEALAVAERVAEERGARLVTHDRRRQRRGAARCGPRGGFQRCNFARRRRRGRGVPRPRARPGGRRARRGARRVVPGRLEVDRRAPADRCSTAPTTRRAPARWRSRSRRARRAAPARGVVGVLDDKDAAAMLGELLPAVDRVVFTRSRQPALAVARRRSSRSREQLGGPPAEIVADPQRRARARARELAGPGGARARHRLDLPHRRPGARRRGRQGVHAVTSPRPPARRPPRGRADRPVRAGHSMKSVSASQSAYAAVEGTDVLSVKIGRRFGLRVPRCPLDGRSTAPASLR